MANLVSIDFKEVRSLLRTRVSLGSTGIPVWGSEAIIPERVVPEDLLVLDGAMTVESYELACDVFKDAEMRGLIAYDHYHALMNQVTRQLYLPPIVEMFGGDKVLTFGYEALYRAAANRTTDPSVAAIVIKRTVMKQVQNNVVEREWPGTPHKYERMQTGWMGRDSGERRHFFFND